MLSYLSLNIPITAGFLFITYLAVAIGILFPLGFLGNLVKAAKWRLLGPLPLSRGIWKNSCERRFAKDQ